MKKMGFIILVIVCVLFVYPSTYGAQSSSDVPIDSEHFPDPLFIEYIQTNFDLDRDNILSKNELDQATTIHFKENMYGAPNPADTVQSLQGIEYFYNLSSLTLYGHEYLQRLDLSQNNKLEKLDFLFGDLIEVKLPNSSSLKELDLFDNSLSKLDLSNCKNLTKLCLDMNGFEKIDLSKLKKLKHLTLANNYLSSIDLSNNTNLEYLELEHNKLKTVDLSNNTSLQSLDISGNNIEKFDAKNFNQLSEIFSDESTDVTVYYSSKNDKNSTTNFKGHCIPNVTIELHDKFSYDSNGNVVIDLSKILSTHLLMEFWEMQEDFDNDTYYPTSLTIPLDELNDKFIKTYTFKTNSSQKQWTFNLKDSGTTETSTSSTEESSSTKTPSSSSTEESSSTKPSSSSTEESSSTKPSSSSTEESSSTKPSSSSAEESSSTKPSSSSTEESNSTKPSSNSTEESSSTKPSSSSTEESSSSNSRYTLEISDFTLPRYADYRQAIKERLIIKNLKGEVVSADKVNLTITSNGNTAKLGKISALLTISYPNETSSKVTVKINVVHGIRIEEADIFRLFYVGANKDSFDPYSVFAGYEIGVDGKETKLGKYDATKKVGVEVLDNPVDFSKAGVYTVRYKITNSLGETLNHTYNVHVQDALKDLTLTATDQVLYVGDILTEDMIYSWAKAENADHLQFEVLNQAIPINKITNQLTKSGEYTIRYIAYQNFGETKDKTIKLTVKDRPAAYQSQNTSAKKNLANTGKVSAGTSEEKGTLPKTGSEQSSVLLSIIGFLLLGLISLTKMRKVFHS